MFNRQWFKPGSQIGLSPLALQVEECINNHNLESAKYLIDRLFIELKDEGYCHRLLLRIGHLSIKRQRYIESIRISFVNFWPDHDPADSQFTDLLIASTSKSILYVTDPSDADIVFFSCYGNTSPAKIAPHALKILFLGENVRPYYRDYDLSLTSDVDTYLGRNIYLPLWMLETDWFGRCYPDRQTFSIRHLITPKVVDLSKRKPAIIYVGNNSEPCRMSLITYLQSMGITVDVYGSHTKPLANKIQEYMTYKMSLCPENSLFPGYITEKPLHSWISATPYIYRSGSHDSPFLANNLCVNIPDHWEANTIFMSSIRSIIEGNYIITATPLFSAEQVKQTFSLLLHRFRTRLRQFLYS